MNVVPFPREARHHPRTGQGLAHEINGHLSSDEAYHLADLVLAHVLSRAQGREVAPLSTVLDEAIDRVFGKSV